MQLRLRDDGRLLEEAEFRLLFAEKTIPEAITKEVAGELGADIVIENPEPERSHFSHISSDVVLDEMCNWRKVCTVVEISDLDERAKIQSVVEEQFDKEVKFAIKKLLDEEAQKSEYDNIHSAALRAAYPGPFHEEGVRYATWMDACWDKRNKIISDVKVGLRPIPTIEEVMAEMPVFSSY